MKTNLKSFKETQAGRYDKTQPKHIQELLDLGYEYEQFVTNLNIDTTNKEESNNTDLEIQIQDLKNQLKEKDNLIKELSNKDLNTDIQEIPYDKLGRMVADLYKKHTTQTKRYEKALDKLEEQKDIVKKYNKIIKASK